MISRREKQDKVCFSFSESRVGVVPNLLIVLAAVDALGVNHWPKIPYGLERKEFTSACDQIQPPYIAAD